MKKKTKQQIFVGIIIVALIIFLGNQFGFFTIIFEEGWLPYGESSNQITQLVKTSTTNYDSKYWTIFSTLPLDHYLQTSANDFYLNSKGDFKLITKEYFDERNFKTEIIVNSETPGGYTTAGGGAELNVYLVTDTSEISVFHKYSQPSGADVSGILEITTSPIDDKVIVYFAGQKVKELTLSQKFKIKIEGATFDACTLPTATSCGIGIIEIINSQYKEQFGCTKLPNEQYYVKIFEYGDSITLGSLPNFNKFCLEEAPLTLYTNIGSATDTQSLIDLVNGETLKVPLGHIWVVEYIGEITDPATICEEGVYNLNEDKCMARTSITFDFGTTEEEVVVVNETTGETTTEIVEVNNTITVATEPYEYIAPSIKTHEEYETQNQILFYHEIVDDESIGGIFNLLGTDFESIYNGQNSFSVKYGDKVFQVSEGQTYELDDYLSVKVNDIYDDKDLQGSGQNDASIEYAILISNNFFDINYSEGKLSVINNYKTVNGGITITKEDILGTTTFENVPKTFNVGSNEFTIDTTNMRNLKIRPYITIVTPDFTYNFDMSKAIDLSIFIDNVTKEVIVNKEVITYKVDSKTKIELILVGVIISIISILGLFYLINGKRK